MDAGLARDRAVVRGGGPDVVQSMGSFLGHRTVGLNFPDHHDNIQQGLDYYYHDHPEEQQLIQFSSAAELLNHANVPDFERTMLAAVDEEEKMVAALKLERLVVGQHHAKVMRELTTCFCYVSIGRAIDDVKRYREHVGPSTMYMGERYVLNDLASRYLAHTDIYHIEGVGTIREYIQDGTLAQDFPGYDISNLLSSSRDPVRKGREPRRLRVLITQPFEVEYGGGVKVRFGGQILYEQVMPKTDEKWKVRLHDAATKFGLQNDTNRSMALSGTSVLWKGFIRHFTAIQFEAAHKFTLNNLSSATQVVQCMNDRGVRLVRGLEGFLYWCETKKCLVTFYTDQKNILAKGIVNFIF